MIDAITTAEAAQIIGCGRRHINKLYYAGLLAGAFYGRMLLIERASALEYQPDFDKSHAIERSQPYMRTL